MNEQDQSYEDAFDMDPPAGAAEKAGEGYGLDPRLKDAADMAAAFDEPKQDEVAALKEAVEQEQAASKPEFKSFGEAFKWHRKNGDKVFEWKGKSFNTKLRSEVQPKAKPKAAPKQDAKQGNATVAKLDLPAIKDPVKVPDQAPGFEILFEEAGKGGVRPEVKAEPAKHVPPFAQQTEWKNPYKGKEQGWASADDEKPTAVAKAGK